MNKQAYFKMMMYKEAADLKYSGVNVGLSAINNTAVNNTKPAVKQPTTAPKQTTAETKQLPKQTVLEKVKQEVHMPKQQLNPYTKALLQNIIDPMGSGIKQVVGLTIPGSRLNIALSAADTNFNAANSWKSDWLTKIMNWLYQLFGGKGSYGFSRNATLNATGGYKYSPPAAK